MALEIVEQISEQILQNVGPNTECERQQGFVTYGRSFRVENDVSRTTKRVVCFSSFSCKLTVMYQLYTSILLNLP